MSLNQSHNDEEMHPQWWFHGDGEFIAEFLYECKAIERNWIEVGVRAVCRVARQQPYLTSEDFLAFMEANGAPMPADLRLTGHVMKKAKKMGVIVEECLKNNRGWTMEESSL
jgi:hypothetical protein